jgi:hypothetical protein
VCWSIVVKEKPTVGSPFFGTFHSDLIPKALKDVNVCFFIHTFTVFLIQKFYTLCQRNFVNYTDEFRELFEATAESMNSPLGTIPGKAVRSISFDKR